MAVLDSDGEMVLALADMAIYDRITVPMIIGTWIHILLLRLGWWWIQTFQLRC